jgi:hypothetical protein
MKIAPNANISPMMQQDGYQGYTGYEDPRRAEKEAMAQAMGLPTSAGAGPNYGKLDRDSAYYQGMLQTGMDYSPTNLTGGLARLANAFVGRQGLNRVEKRENEYAEQEAATAQAQKDKFAEMARMMAGPDADPQVLAMAQMFPEEFAKSRFSMQEAANKPQDPFVVNDQIVDRSTLDVQADLRDPEKPQEMWEPVAAPEGMPGMYERSTLTGKTRRVATPPRAGIRVNADGSVEIGGPAQQAADLLDPPQTKGKDAALVFDSDGFARVSPNAQQKGLNAAALKFNDLKAKNDLVSDDIRRALDVFTVVDPETGVRSVNPDQRAVGSYAALKDIPIFGGSTKAGTLESYLTTLQANVGFGELQAMREASPTGGALGQVSEREIAFLQALLGDIEQSRDPQILMYNLERLDTFMAGRQDRFQKAFEADYPTASEYVDRREGARTEVEDLLNLYLDEE